MTILYGTKKVKLYGKESQVHSLIIINGNFKYLKRRKSDQFFQDSLKNGKHLIEIDFF